MLAEVGSDLIGIAGRDGGELLAVVGSRAEAGHAKISVVDCEHNLRPPQPIGLVVLPEGLRHACRAPVMAVQDVWLTACLQQKLQSSLQQPLEFQSRGKGGVPMQ